MQRLSQQETTALKSLNFKDVKPVLEKAGVKRDLTEDNYIEKLTFAIKLGMIRVTYDPKLEVTD